MSKNEKKRGGKQFSEDYQPPKESKRVKKKKTILLEKVGMDSWESVANFLNTDGSDQLIAELKTLKGKAFIDAFLAAMEYFKPKLSRAEVTGKDGVQLIPPVINVIERKND